jgi:hypothetical protein
MLVFSELSRFRQPGNGIQHIMLARNTGACYVEMLGDRVGIGHALPPCLLQKYRKGDLTAVAHMVSAASTISSF